MMRTEIPDTIMFLSKQGFSTELLKYLVLDRYSTVIPLTETAEIKLLYKQLELAMEQNDLLTKEYNDQFAVASAKGIDHAKNFLRNYDAVEITVQKEIRLDRLHELTRIFRTVEPNFPLYKKDRFSNTYKKFEFFLKMFF